MGRSGEFRRENTNGLKARAVWQTRNKKLICDDFVTLGKIGNLPGAESNLRAGGRPTWNKEPKESSMGIKNWFKRNNDRRVVVKSEGWASHLSPSDRVVLMTTCVSKHIGCQYLPKNQSINPDDVEQ